MGCTLNIEVKRVEKAWFKSIRAYQKYMSKLQKSLPDNQKVLTRYRIATVIVIIETS